MNQISDKWCAVVNPHAGSGRAALHWRKAEQMLSDKGVDFVCRRTESKFHAMEISFLAADEGYRKFMAVGGDGTVHEVLGGIVNYVESALAMGREVSLSEFYLAVIPIGSGNDWIKSHGLSYDLESAADLIVSESFVPQDIVKVSHLDAVGTPQERITGCFYMVNIGGVGLDADICKHVNDQKDRGRQGKMLYLNSLIYNFFRRKHSPVRLVSDGNTVFEGQFLSIAFGICKYSGGGFRQTPSALFDDGLLDFTVIPKLSAMKILKEARRLFDGSLDQVKELTVGRGRSMTLLPLSDIRPAVEVDGEVTGVLPARLEVLPVQINVLHKRT